MAHVAYEDIGDAATADAGTMQITVLLPCLNEAETLAVCIRHARDAITNLQIDGEILVADNGSTDGSPEIAASLGARVLHVSERGYGAALRSGIAAAHGEFVIMADSDDSYALEDLGAYAAELRAGADLVIGNRFLGGIEPRAMPALHRYLGNPVLSFLGRRLFSVPVGDFHCGMRGMRRDAIMRLGLRAKGMEFASEMVIKAAVNGLTIREVPTLLRPDGRSHKPHLRTWRDGWRHLRLLLLFSPRWLFFYPGALLSIAGFAGLVWLLPGPRHVLGLRLDLQSMLFFALGLVTGTQSCLLYRVGHLVAVALGMLPDDRRSGRMRRWSLEHGIVVGLLLAGLGTAGLLTAVLQWGEAGFGSLNVETSMRWAIASFTVVVVGLQFLLTSFLAGLSQIDTW